MTSSAAPDGTLLRATIIAGGRVTTGPRVLSALRDTDLLIAADRGVTVCLELNLTPDLVIGDFDSTPPADLAAARERGWTIQTHPTEKAATDGELAIQAALDRGATTITMAGVLEGDDRVDHALGNILLLAHPGLRGRKVRLLDEMREAQLIRGGELGSVSGARGDLISLLPLTETAAGVTTWGLKYDLAGIPLQMGSTRGVSNELVGTHGQISLADGMLLIFHERRTG